MTDNITMDRHSNTNNKGKEEASISIAGNKIWLRAYADIHPGPGHTATFFYSQDGTAFLPLGPSVVLNANWPFFMGYRFGIFNYATRDLGGWVEIRSFTLEAKPK